MITTDELKVQLDAYGKAEKDLDEAQANDTSLPEQYGDTARYYDPKDYAVNLDELAAQPVAAPDEVLQKYSWDRTANFWLHEIEKYAKQ